MKNDASSLDTWRERARYPARDRPSIETGEEKAIKMEIRFLKAKGNEMYLNKTPSIENGI